MDSLVTVIIPCYQQGRFLPEAVASLQRQSYANWEAIIVNDGSTDDTESIARRLCGNDPRLRYLSKRNGGLSSARNAGLRSSTGAYIQLLDADDLLDARKFERQVAVFLDHPEVSVVYGNAKYFTDGAFGEFRRSWSPHGPAGDWIAERWSDAGPFLGKLVNGNLLPVCTPLLRRSLTDLVGEFKEGLGTHEDWDYWVRCAASGARFAFHDLAGTESFIRVHDGCMTADPQHMKSGEYLARLGYHEILPPGAARDLNLAHLLAYCYSRGEKGRRERYASLSRACSARERCLVEISRLCDAGGRLSSLACRLGQRLPWRFRLRISALGFGFC